MAVSSLYSYHYRVVWLPDPELRWAGENGVGRHPRLRRSKGCLTLERGASEPSEHGYLRLCFDLGWVPDLRDGDELELVRTVGNAHESLTVRRDGHLLLHVGHLLTLSGEVLESAGPLELVNDADESGCLRVELAGQEQRVAVGSRADLDGYRLGLHHLRGACLGRCYGADGWIALHDLPCAPLETACADPSWKCDQFGGHPPAPRGFWRTLRDAFGILVLGREPV